MEGRMDELRFDSGALKENALQDPSERDVLVYLPPGFDKDKSGFPTVFMLPGYSGTGRSMTNVYPWGEQVPQQIDRLILAGEIRPVVAVFPDCWTRCGGSQYIDSPIGNYQQYLIEVLCFLEGHYGNKLRAHRDFRAIVGHSSGGYGALQMGMSHPDVFGYVADHAGDKAFDLCYMPNFPNVCAAVDKEFGGRNDKEEALFQYVIGSDWPRLGPAGTKPVGPNFAIMDFATMCTAYSPPGTLLDGRLASPVDLDTCGLVGEVWGEWLRHDPVRQVEDGDVRERLGELGYLYLDCGRHDEYNLQFGMRQLARKLEAYGVPYHCEEFPGGHRHTSYRYGRSLALIGGAMPE